MGVIALGFEGGRTLVPEALKVSVFPGKAVPDQASEKRRVRAIQARRDQVLEAGERGGVSAR